MHVVKENNHLKHAIRNFQVNEELNDREITRFNATMDVLNKQNSEMKDEIKKKDNEISFIKFIVKSKKTEVVNTKKQLEEAIQA